MRGLFGPVPVAAILHRHVFREMVVKYAESRESGT